MQKHFLKLLFAMVVPLQSNKKSNRKLGYFGWVIFNYLKPQIIQMDNVPEN